jgi:hypothetical protein
VNGRREKRRLMVNTHHVHPGATLRERLEFRGWTVTESGCWEWKGCRFKDGYGRIAIKRKNYLVHRISYEAFNGSIDPNLLVRHRCDNPPCMNPDHLVQGTDQDNADDMVSRGRVATGDRHGKTKLTDVQVAEMRELYRDGDHTQMDIARLYNTPHPTVNAILRGKRRAA